MHYAFRGNRRFEEKKHRSYETAVIVRADGAPSYRLSVFAAAMKQYMYMRRL